MRVLHISPTYFSDRSFIGGGERYAYGLARAMSQAAQVVFLSFASEPSSHTDGTLRVEHIERAVLFKANPLSANPSSRRFLKWWCRTV